MRDIMSLTSSSGVKSLPTFFFQAWYSALLTPSEQTVISVTNDGLPISRENQDEIFVPFFTTKQEGTGIGLSLSRQIMRLHNGSLTLTRSDGAELCLRFCAGRAFIQSDFVSFIPLNKEILLYLQVQTLVINKDKSVNLQ